MMLNIIHFRYNTNEHNQNQTWTVGSGYRWQNRQGPAVLHRTRRYHSEVTRLLLSFMFRVCLIWQLPSKHNFNIFGLSQEEAPRRHSGWNGVLSQVKSSFLVPCTSFSDLNECLSKAFTKESEWFSSGSQNPLTDFKPRSFASSN